jgi:dihydroxyacetone kinase DhaKLM complex PTS-EIIA-like component DhaM
MTRLGMVLVTHVADVSEGVVNYCEKLPRM